MKRKKHSLLGEDCQAVSEVMGQILMMSIVVLAFSSIGITIFSDVVVDPPHTPHIDLQANLQNSISDPNKNYTLYIFHMGGEVIDLNDMKIVCLNSSEQRNEFTDLGNNSWSSEGNKLSNGILALGDYIKLDFPKDEVKITISGTVDMYFVHTPSQQVIQKFTFHI